MDMIENRKECSGCMACMQICEKGAIEKNSNEKGFWYPQINPDKCVDCGLCRNVCASNQSGLCNEEKISETWVFGARHCDNTILDTSQSGGLFFGLAQVILEEGGVCYGAAIAESFEVRQIRIEEKEDLKKLQGSKYVQSDTNSTFKLVEHDLKNGIVVLYSGTSCMIAGLKQYLSVKKIPMENLITCDLICNGIPSPMVYRDNLKRLEEENGSKLKSLKFRDKSYGWRSYMESYQFMDGTEKKETYYLELFAHKTIVRESCYTCKYVEYFNRPADITMGDFWGIEECYQEFASDNRGCSLAIIHTKKGMELFTKGNFNTFETNIKDGMYKNMAYAPSKPKQYGQFWKSYKRDGYSDCLKKYSSYGGIVTKVKRKILKNLKRW